VALLPIVAAVLIAFLMPQLSRCGSSMRYSSLIRPSVDRQEVGMKRLAATIASLSLIASSTQAEETRTVPLPKPMPTLDEVRTVAPALEKYMQGPLLGDL
jgi:hypothetical protein